MKKLGMNLSPEDAKAEFAKADKNGGGQILFKEFCDYIAGLLGFDIEADDAKWKDSTKSSKKSKKKTAKELLKDFNGLDVDAVRKAVAPGEAEQKALKMINDKAFLEKLWDQCDFNGNGGCSLAEIDKAFLEKLWDQCDFNGNGG